VFSTVHAKIKLTLLIFLINDFASSYLPIHVARGVSASTETATDYQIISGIDRKSERESALLSPYLLRVDDDGA